MFLVILILQALASLNLMGLIGCIQWVHYPMFSRLERAGFADSLRWHGERISWLVGPWMLLELFCALLLYFYPPWPSRWFDAGLALVVGLWFSTGLIFVPLHGRLARGYDARTLRWLILCNWLRTLLWSARGFLSIYLLVRQ